MKRLLLILSIAISSITLLAANAEAKRLGGGSSTGKQRSVSPEQTQKAPAAAPAPAAPAAPAAGNKWLGPLAGLAIGAGLASMFMGGGLGAMGGALGSILMMVALAALVMFLIAKYRRSQQPAMQFSGQGAPYTQPEQPVAMSGASISAAPEVKNIPADFPVDAFLRSAKMSFIRLQAANDRKDLNDIREYTTPEMFAEISLQLQERGAAVQTTDVLVVNAVLLEVVTENNHAIASVRMTGQLTENKGATENFDEIWHVQKNLQDDKAVWLLSGIQQVV
jgi:predicted lipid-binding transport protein (Tim44 family)